jgi:hydrogenase maturation protease
MSTVIIGIGNEYRRDDAAGIVAVRRLRLLEAPGVRMEDSDGEPTSLIDLWSDSDLAIVIDAVAANGEPGRVYRMGLHHPAADRRGTPSSHRVSLGDAVALARALDRLPPRLLLYGIEVAEAGPGLGLSAPVARSVAAVSAEIADLVGLRPSVAR